MEDSVMFDGMKKSYVKGWRMGIRLFAFLMYPCLLCLPILLAGAIDSPVLKTCFQIGFFVVYLPFALSWTSNFSWISIAGPSVDARAKVQVKLKNEALAKGQ